VNAKLLGTIKIKRGNAVTYDQHPLYTSAYDVKPGIIRGEGSSSFGAAWWLVSPAGNAITKKSSRSSRHFIPVRFWPKHS
jgi:hypothetical protein